MHMLHARQANKNREREKQEHEGKKSMAAADILIQDSACVNLFLPTFSMPLSFYEPCFTWDEFNASNII